MGEVQTTPLALRVPGLPIPVAGSDGRLHVVYELELVNATADIVSLEQLQVLDAHGGTIATLGAAELGQRLVVRDRAALLGSVGASQAGIIYLHLIFDSAADIPLRFEHRLSGLQAQNAFSQAAGCFQVTRPTELLFDSPLRGQRFIAGDGCCDSVRHIRATLALNGHFATAQRFAIDWEQLDAQGRIYVGDPKNPQSYIIYGKPAYAIADARVVAAEDGLPDSPTGAFPANLRLDKADGNHVVLDFGNGRYALYAHFKPGSVRVREGAHVHSGEVLGLVGTSGNSSEPHLHFQVTDGPSTFDSSGVPYRLPHFSSTRRGVSTAAFDKAIIDGQPIATEPVPQPAWRYRELPLDLWIVDFPE